MPNPTREEYGRTIDAIIRKSPSLSGTIIKVFMVHSLDNPERLQLTTRCFGHPHDGYGKQVDTLIARSALAMVNASLHCLHIQIRWLCTALSFILWASEFDATNGTLFGGFLGVPVRIQSMVRVTSHARTPILHFYLPAYLHTYTHTYEGRLISNAHSEISRKRDHVFKQTKVGSKVQYFSYKFAYLFFDIVTLSFNTFFPT